jgi:tetratricopeptide (TPR) repeat protein
MGQTLGQSSYESDKAVEPASDPDAAYELGMKLYKENSFAKAIGPLESFIAAIKAKGTESDERFGEAYTILGHCFYGVCLALSLFFHFFSVLLICLSSGASWQSALPKRCRECYLKAVELGASDSVAEERLAQYYFQQSDFKQAKELATKCLSHSHSASAYELLLKLR